MLVLDTDPRLGQRPEARRPTLEELLRRAAGRAGGSTPIADAKLLEAPLLTADRRLARAGGIRCDIDVLE